MVDIEELALPCFRSAPAGMGVSLCNGHGVQFRLNAQGQLGVGERWAGLLSLSILIEVELNGGQHS